MNWRQRPSRNTTPSCVSKCVLPGDRSGGAWRFWISLIAHLGAVGDQTGSECPIDSWHELRRVFSMAAALNSALQELLLPARYPGNLEQPSLTEAQGWLSLARLSRDAPQCSESTLC